MIQVKNGSTLLVVFRAYLASDHVTPATGKTIAVTISKNGGAFGNPNAGALNATEISSGFYKASLDATDTGTDGPLAVRGAVATVDDVGVLYYVGSTPADVVKLLGTAWLTPGTAGTPDVNVKLWNALTTVALPLVPATPGRTLVVDAAGLADANMVKAGPSGSGTAQTAGDLFGLLSLRSGTAQAGGSATTIVLDAGASATDSFYVGRLIVLTGGTGSGRGGLITAYIGATKTATVNTSWVSSPDGTTTFVILRTWGEILGVSGNVGGSVGGNVTGSVGTIGAGGISAASFAAGAIDSAAIATGAIDADAVAADAVTEIQSGLASQASVNTIDDLLDTEMPALTTAVADLPTNAELATALGTADDAVLAAIAALNNLSAAQVNAEVVDALNVDTYAQPGQGTPAATTTIRLMIAYLYKAFRNRKNQTATLFQLFNDDATTVDQKAITSDDLTTGEVGEIASGP